MKNIYDVQKKNKLNTHKKRNLKKVKINKKKLIKKIKNFN